MKVEKQTDIHGGGRQIGSPPLITFVDCVLDHSPLNRLHKRLCGARILVYLSRSTNEKLLEIIMEKY